MSRVDVAQPLRKEDGQWLADCLRCRPAKGRFGPVVEDDDSLRFVDGDDRVDGQRRDSRSLLFGGP